MSEDPEIAKIQKLLKQRNSRSFNNLRSLLLKLKHQQDEREAMEKQLTGMAEVSDEAKSRFLDRYDIKIAEIMNALQEIVFSDEKA